VLVALRCRIRDRSGGLSGGILAFSPRSSGLTFSCDDVKLSSPPRTTPSPVPDLSVTEGDDPFAGARSSTVSSYCAGFGEGNEVVPAPLAALCNIRAISVPLAPPFTCSMSSVACLLTHSSALKKVQLPLLHCLAGRRRGLSSTST
jgi:hypothetical protein